MNETCSVCLTEEITDRCSTNCGHHYCKECLDSWFDQGKNTCPICRQELNYITHNGETYRVVVRSVVQPAVPGTIGGAEFMYIHVRLYRFIQGLTLAMALTICYELYRIYDIHLDNQDLSRLNKSCMRLLSLGNDFIDEISYQRPYPLMLDNMIQTCMIPVYYIRECLE